MNKFIKKLYLFLMILACSTTLIIKKNDIKSYVFGDQLLKSYSFTGSRFETSDDEFECLVEGHGFLNNGVQVTKNKSGASAISKTSFTNVQKIVATYCTNASKGSGSIRISVGETQKALEVTKEGGNTSRKLDYSFNGATGKIEIYVIVDENSIYLQNLDIYFGDGEYIEPETPVDPSLPDEPIVPENPNNPAVTYGALEVTYTGDYYNTIDESLSGNDLLKALGNKLNDKTIDIGYSGLWQAYKTTDIKPGTNYVYDMYSNYNYVLGSSAQGANYSKEGDAYNREHIVPQSWFGSQTPMKSDLFNVVPTDGWVNALRGNYPHGNVIQTPTTKTTGNDSKLGGCNSTYYSGTVFEVIDEYKGDFARSYLYMATRYYARLAGWGSGANVVFKGSFPYLSDYAINTYISWALNDPVSEKEITRNNEVYKYQNNRNPFIDNPNYMVLIWGSQTSFPTNLLPDDPSNPPGEPPIDPPNPPIEPPETPTDPEIDYSLGLEFEKGEGLTSLLASVSVSNKKATLTSANLTYSLYLSNELYNSILEKDSNACFGMLLVDGFYDFNKVKEKETINEILSLEYSITNTDSYSQKEVDQRQKFSVLNPDDSGNLRKSYVAIFYLNYQGKLFFAKPTTYSIKSMAEKLIDNYEKSTSQYLILDIIRNSGVN